MRKLIPMYSNLNYELGFHKASSLEKAIEKFDITDWQLIESID